LVVGLTGISLLSLTGGLSGAALGDATVLRDALILGTAGAMTAKTSARLLRTTESANALARILRIEELAGVAGLAVIAAYFRPHEGAWQLPGTAWLLLTLGLGATVGILSYAMLQFTKHERPEFVVLTLGSVSFAAGLAATLHLSPLVVTFIAGVLLANFPGAYHVRLGAALRRLERPVYLISLFAIGALWDVADWRGWLLVPVFMSTRLIGKRVGASLAARGTDSGIGLDEREALAVAPMAPLAIAIVVNAQLLYPGGSVSLIASAVIGGAILTEVVVQLVTHGGVSTLERRARARAARDGEDRSREALR
jgi:Kef-type K+ transport system membrane component KefB